MNTNSVKKFHIEDIEFSEIDFDLYDKFNLDMDVEDIEDFPCLEDDGKDSKAEYTYPIEIDLLIQKLNELKTKGANYAQIYYHCDHIGYEISGWLIRKVTQEDIELEKIKQKELEEESKQKQLKELKEKISKLKEDINARQI